MKKLIVYGTQYGTTKRYAEKFSEIMDTPCISYEEVKALSNYDVVIHFGGLYAGGVKGLKTTIKALPENTRLIIEGDVCRTEEYFPAASFDVVTCNPPYMTGSHGLTNASQAKTIARHEVLCSFEDIAKAAARVLRPGGRFYLVHRPFRLAEILFVLKQYQLEPKRMQLVYPFVDKEPNLVLLEAAKGGRPRITVEKPLIVYEKPGVYTEDIRILYGDGR